MSTTFAKYAVLDGGFSTELVSRGHSDIDGDPLWSARLISSNPRAIEEVHLSFLENGSDIIETSTYQASIPGFMRHLDLSRSAAFELIVKGARLACETRDAFWNSHPELHQKRRKPLVAGSLGPYGAFLADGSEYSGSYMMNELLEFHKPHVAALVKAGVDLIAFDTIPVQSEAVLLGRLMQMEFPESKAWISFSCKNEKELNSGEMFCRGVESLLDYSQIIGIGVNCCPPEYVEGLLKSLPSHIRKLKTLVVYPNSGESWSDEKKWVKEKETKPFISYVDSWIEAGATWIGGCCRTTPEDIFKVRTLFINKGLL